MSVANLLHLQMASNMLVSTSTISATPTVVSQNWSLMFASLLLNSLSDEILVREGQLRPLPITLSLHKISAYLRNSGYDGHCDSHPGILYFVHLDSHPHHACYNRYCKCDHSHSRHNLGPSNDCDHLNRISHPSWAFSHRVSYSNWDSNSGYSHFFGRGGLDHHGDRKHHQWRLG